MSLPEEQKIGFAQPRTTDLTPEEIAELRDIMARNDHLSVRVQGFPDAIRMFATAVNAMPRMLDEIERLRAELERARYGAIREMLEMLESTEPVEGCWVDLDYLHGQQALLQMLVEKVRSMLEGANG